MLSDYDFYQRWQNELRDRANAKESHLRQLAEGTPKQARKARKRAKVQLRNSINRFLDTLCDDEQ